MTGLRWRVQPLHRLKIHMLSFKSGATPPKQGPEFIPMILFTIDQLVLIVPKMKKKILMDTYFQIFGLIVIFTI